MERITIKDGTNHYITKLNDSEKADYKLGRLEDFDCPYCAWIKDDEELNCITHEVLDEEEQGKVEQLTLW